MKLMSSTMLSAAIKRQYSSVLPLLCHCLPGFKQVCGTAINFVLFRPNLIANTPLDIGPLHFLARKLLHCTHFPSIEGRRLS